MALTRSSTLLLLLLRVSVLFLIICSTSASDPPQKVTLSLYYESLCPYSASFIVKQLVNIFNNGLIDIVDLQLIPFGNAEISDDGSINCQHGPDEWLLNTVEACAIDAWPDVEEHYNFILCIEKMAVEGTYGQWKTCFDKLGVDSQSVLKCSAGDYGKKLQYKYGEETKDLVPPLKYVPWVVVNGKPVNDIDKFETAVCKAYKGELPEACED